MITCRELTELITDYLEKRLGLWARIRFQLHLGMCRHCREYLRQVRLMLRLLPHLPPPPPPPEVEAQLLYRFRHWKLSASR